MDLHHSWALLRRVSRRQSIVALGRHCYVALVWLACTYALILLLSRLLGVIPDRFEPATLLAVPLLAVLIAAALYRRPPAADAARAIDRHSRSKDLFLTVALLEQSPGDFKPLVATAAEQKAPHIKAADVVPFGGLKRAATALAAVLMLFLGIQFLPQLDPLGKVEAAEELDRSKQELAESKQATRLRAEQIESEKKSDADAQEVEKSIDKLKTTLKKMKLDAPQSNQKRLVVNQKALGEKWRKLSAQRLNELLAEQSISQQFGGSNTDLQKKWLSDLQSGSADSLKQELQAIKKDLEQLMKTDDPAKREELKRKLEKKLQALTDFSTDKLNSKPLAAALKRTMQQLQMSQASDEKQLSTEALTAAAESLKLGELELDMIAQSAEDLKKLEEALKVLQMAKQLNGMNKLDGEGTEACQTMEDYAAMYGELLAEMPGPGLRGMGLGEGNIAPEDDAQTTGFKTEQSKSAIVAGKILLSLKTKGMGEQVDAKDQYRSAVRQVRQGVSEAILQEQIPPGYHDGIKKYFDNINESAEQPAGTE